MMIRGTNLVVLIGSLALFTLFVNIALAFFTENREGTAEGETAAMSRESETQEGDLLPDLVPLPPQDLALEESEGEVLLVFSTTYYNQGEGALELAADESVVDVRGDVESPVLQRIYQDDGGYRMRMAGTFLWHEEHIHYHFEDFVNYVLTPVSVSGEAGTEQLEQKSTFCVRDVSRVDINGVEEYPAQYRICNKDIQGVTPGWGDTYFYDYPDQDLTVTDLPSGTYRLLFIVNPRNRFLEATQENNTSSALLELDPEAGEVRLLETEPASYPEVEHVYPEQDFSFGDA